MNFRIFNKYSPEFARCGNCKEVGTLKKSRSRGLMDKIAKLFFFRLYFCRSCQQRNRYFTLKFTRFWIRTLVLYIIIIGLTAVIVYYYLEKFI